MKPLSLDNLRRLLGGGGRKKKDRQPEPTFKRSDSFKRISIRKNYLDRGKGRRAQPQQPTIPEKPPKQEQQDSDPLLIGYGQWIKCMRNEDYEHLKELTRSMKDVPPTPPPRKKYTATSTDSSLEILKLDTSPVPSRRRLEERADSGLSVSLGRVWMDAPLAMANAPRSLELPRAEHEAVRRVHHSLESGLKQPQVGRRYSPAPTPIARTLSSGTQATSTGKTVSSRSSTELLSSSKDSGFSFSISIPRLSDLSPPGSGAFRKSRVCESRGDGSLRKGKRRGSGRRKKSGGEWSADMYQVVVSRPGRCLKSLKLDPMMFVPPERRKAPSGGRLAVQEVRDYCSPRDLRREPSPDPDEGLYECISGDPDSDRFETLSEEEEEEEYRPVVIRRPVRRKKSGKAKYIAKPTIHRAPSTLKRNKKLLRKQETQKLESGKQCGCHRHFEAIQPSLPSKFYLQQFYL